MAESNATMESLVDGNAGLVGDGTGVRVVGVGWGCVMVGFCFGGGLCLGRDGRAKLGPTLTGDVVGMACNLILNMPP